MGMLILATQGRLFGLDAQLIHDALILGVNIFIIFVAASYLLFNPARALLKKRQDKIQADLDAAAADREKAAGLIREYESKLENIESEADAIMTDARNTALVSQAKIVAEAKTEAQSIIRRAENEIELERRRAIENMKQDIIDIAQSVAQSAVCAKMDAKVDEALVDDAIRQMGEDTWQSR